jgi:ribosomal protein S18 acetylase RimI-like enzyme
MTGALDIRVMSAADLGLALDMAAAEGWNPGLHDAACFRAADPSGFLIGRLDGEAVATISVVRYGADKGFLGCYIVKPGLRGQGHGLAIWQAGMAYLAGRNVGLDGVPAQQANYRRSGYTLAFRNIRYVGTGSGTRPPGLVPLSAVPPAAVLDYDRAMFTADRADFIAGWIAQPDALALGAVADGRLAGFGVRRRCRDGSKIGPLFADDAATAERLFVGLAAGSDGQPIFLDVPECNGEAVALAERHGMKPSFETARMYTGPAWPIPLPRLYGVTTFELG